MASRCPKCHQVLDEDAICCATLTHTWKCRACGKLSSGFVVPYGRCFLCGGENRVVESYANADEATKRIVEEALREAVQFELDMYHFYRLAHARVRDETLRAVLEDLCDKEAEHLEELEQKYHVHFDDGIKTSNPSADEIMAGALFEGIDFDDVTKQVPAVYERAIALEQRTRDRFIARARDLPEGPEKELFRELAAEEVEHVALLEGERDLLLGS